MPDPGVGRRARCPFADRARGKRLFDEVPRTAPVGRQNAVEVSPFVHSGNLSRPLGPR